MKNSIESIDEQSYSVNQPVQGSDEVCELVKEILPDLQHEIRKQLIQEYENKFRLMQQRYERQILEIVQHKEQEMRRLYAESDNQELYRRIAVLENQRTHWLKMESNYQAAIKSMGEQIVELTKGVGSFNHKNTDNSQDHNKENQLEKYLGIQQARSGSNCKPQQIPRQSSSSKSQTQMVSQPKKQPRKNKQLNISSIMKVTQSSSIPFEQSYNATRQTNHHCIDIKTNENSHTHNQKPKTIINNPPINKLETKMQIISKTSNVTPAKHSSYLKVQKYNVSDNDSIKNYLDKTQSLEQQSIIDLKPNQYQHNKHYQSVLSPPKNNEHQHKQYVEEAENKRVSGTGNSIFWNEENKKYLLSLIKFK